jgi:hypothetical protein
MSGETLQTPFHRQDILDVHGINLAHCECKNYRDAPTVHAVPIKACSEPRARCVPVNYDWLSGTCLTAIFYITTAGRLPESLGDPLDDKELEVLHAQLPEAYGA